MAVRGDVLPVPTLEQAQAAAGVLAEEGVSAVLLHGSVAAGTAREGSDIDVVAVFDDIDYAERFPLRWRLEAMCTAAAGVPVDVHVTDWPEWRRRIVEVSSSFEAAVAANARTLSGREPAADAVNWAKEIGMPDSNLGEAIARLADLRQSLSEMATQCRPEDRETRIVGGVAETVPWIRETRLRALCADASMTIENALKTWCALSGTASERTHSIARLIEVAGVLPADLQVALAALQPNTMRPSREAYDDVSSWRIGGTYPSALPQATPDKTERLSRLLSAAAVTAADATLRRVLDDGADQDNELLVTCVEVLRHAQSVLAANDPVTGKQLDSAAEPATATPPATSALA